MLRKKPMRVRWPTVVRSLLRAAVPTYARLNASPFSTHTARTSERNAKRQKEKGCGEKEWGNTIAEDTVKVCAHVYDLRVLKDPAINEVAKLLAEHVSSDEALNSIGSIDAVQTTCPDHGCLQSDSSQILLIKTPPTSRILI